MHCKHSNTKFTYFYFYLIQKISSNPIVYLLTDKILTWENFPKWKSNINIVLIIENVRLFSLRSVLKNRRQMLPEGLARSMTYGSPRTIRPKGTCSLVCLILFEASWKAKTQLLRSWMRYNKCLDNNPSRRAMKSLKSI